MQSNKSSKSRKAIEDKITKHLPYLKPGDILFYLSIPAHQQGKIRYRTKGLTAAQFEGSLSAVQQGIVKSRNARDPRLAALLKGVSKQRAAQEAVAGDHDQPQHLCFLVRRYMHAREIDILYRLFTVCGTLLCWLRPCSTVHTDCSCFVCSGFSGQMWPRSGCVSGVCSV